MSKTETRLGGRLWALRLPLALLGPPLIIFWASSVELVRRNAEYFEGMLVAWPLLLGGAVYLLIGVSLYFFKPRSNIFEGALYAYLISGALWIVYIAALPLAGIAAVLSFAAAAVIGGALFVSRHSEKDLITSVLAVFTVAFFVSTALQLFEIQRRALGADVVERGGFERETEPIATTPARNLPDIYHIVFDEFQTEMFEAVLNAHLKERLGGVIWFPDSSTPYGRTEMALASVFSGTPYDYREAPLNYISRAFSSGDSLIPRLKSLGYETIGFLHQIYPRGGASPFDHSYFHKNFAKASVMAQRKLFVSVWLYAHLPDLLSRRLLPQHHVEQLTSRTLLPDDAPVVSLQSFRQFIAWESDTTRRGGRYIFIHLILPHFPNVLGADCSYRPGLRTTLEDQTTCTTLEIAELLDLLEDRDKFENALILMHGDHGKGVLYENGTLRAATDKFYGRDWSWGRSRPLSLLKPVGASRSSDFSSDHRPMDLLDIFPTILASVGSSPDDALVGNSLVAEPVSKRQRHYHFYDKDRVTIVDGTIKRYEILPHDIRYDTEISVPK